MRFHSTENQIDQRSIIECVSEPATRHVYPRTIIVVAG